PSVPDVVQVGDLLGRECALELLAAPIQQDVVDHRPDQPSAQYEAADAGGANERSKSLAARLFRGPAFLCFGGFVLKDDAGLSATRFAIAGTASVIRI